MILPSNLFDCDRCQSNGFCVHDAYYYYYYYYNDYCLDLDLNLKFENIEGNSIISSDQKWQTDRQSDVVYYNRYCSNGISCYLLSSLR